jgi:hypothetical protein
MSTEGQLVWVVVIVGAIVLFWSPVIVAAIRGTYRLWIVILLTVLTPIGGVTWFGAWFAAFAFPRKPPAPPYRPAPPPDPFRAPLAPREDPRYSFGAVPPQDPPRNWPP